jgi:hypothetical protein
LKRVLVVHNNLLLVAGVESLLLRQLDLVVKGTPFISKKALIQEINHFHPHVILLDYSLQISEIIFCIFSMPGFQDIRVMAVNIENNYVHIFDKYQIEVRQGKDFLNALLLGARIP